MLDGLAGLRHSTPIGGGKLAPKPGGDVMPAIRRALVSACAALEQMEVALLSRGSHHADTAGYCGSISRCAASLTPKSLSVGKSGWRAFAARCEQECQHNDSRVKHS